MTGIPQDAIDAAQAHDVAHRPARRNWTRVPDDQVERLLEGAALHTAAKLRDQLAERDETIAELLGLLAMARDQYGQAAGPATTTEGTR